MSLFARAASRATSVASRKMSIGNNAARPFETPKIPAINAEALSRKGLKFSAFGPTCCNVHFCCCCGGCARVVAMLLFCCPAGTSRVGVFFVVADSGIALAIGLCVFVFV